MTSKVALAVAAYSAVKFVKYSVVAIFYLTVGVLRILFDIIMELRRVAIAIRVERLKSKKAQER